MEPFAYTACGALGGVLVTALVAMWNARRTHERELVAMAIQAATAEFGHAVDMVKTKGEGAVPPLYAYIHWHVAVARLLSRNQLTVERLAILKTEQRMLTDQAKSWSIKSP